MTEAAYVNSTVINLIIPTGAYPDFLLHGFQQRPRMRLSVKRGA
jgi:hypothetical protein